MKVIELTEGEFLGLRAYGMIALADLAPVRVGKVYIATSPNFPAEQVMVKCSQNFPKVIKCVDDNNNYL